MIFTLALARYLSERTAQEDVSAGTPGATDCTNGICGQMINTCSAKQPAFSSSYDVQFNSSNTEASSIKLRKVTYSFCLNPRTNLTHKTLYQQLGSGVWEDEKDTAGLPSWSCYKIGQVNITPPPATPVPTATSAPTPTSGGGGATTVPSPTSGGGATTVPSPTSGGGGVTSTPTPRPTAATCSGLSEVQCSQYPNCFWENGGGSGAGQCSEVDDRPIICTAGKYECKTNNGTPPTMSVYCPDGKSLEVVMCWNGCNWTTGKCHPAPGSDSDIATDRSSTASTPQPFTHSFVFGPEVIISAATKTTNLREIAALYNTFPNLMDPAVTFDVKAVAEGVNSAGTLIKNDQIIGKRLSFHENACLTTNNSNIPNGSFERARGNFNEGGFVNWYFSAGMDKVNTRVHDCNQFGPCVDGRNYAVLARTIGQPDAHISSEWIQTNTNLSGRTIRVKFDVKAHNGTSGAKLKGLFIQREHPVGGTWLEQIPMPESALTGVWQTKTFDLKIPDSTSLNTTRFRIVLRPEMDLGYQLGLYYDFVRYELLPPNTATVTPVASATPTPTPSATIVPGAELKILKFEAKVNGSVTQTVMGGQAFEYNVSYEPATNIGGELQVKIPLSVTVNPSTLPQGCVSGFSSSQVVITCNLPAGSTLTKIPASAQHYGPGNNSIITYATVYSGNTQQMKTLSMTVTAPVTPTPTTTPVVGSQYLTQTFLATRGDSQVLIERNCTVGTNTTGETITSTCPGGWKVRDLTSLTQDSEELTAFVTEKKINSVNFYRQFESTPSALREAVRVTILADSRHLFYKTCLVETDTLNCDFDNNQHWIKTNVGSLSLPDIAFSNTADKKIRSYDATIVDHTNVTPRLIRNVVLSEDGKAQWTRQCNFEAQTCGNWTAQGIPGFNFDNPAFTVESLAGLDHHTQIYNGVSQIRQSWLHADGTKYFTRLCPKNNTGTFDCSLSTADPQKKLWSQVNVTTASGFPTGVTNVIGMDRFISAAKNLNLEELLVTPSVDVALVECRDKTATFLDNNKKPNSRVEYLVRLRFPAVPVSGTVVVRDDFPESLEILEHPTFCQIKTGESNSAVLGISDYNAERGSLLIGIVLLAALSGGVAYLIVSHNKGSIKIQLLSDKPYLVALLVAGGVLLVGSVYFMMKNEDVSPSDSSADTVTGQYLECTISGDRRQFKYTAKIKGTPGTVVNNQVEVVTGGTKSDETCENSFTIAEGPTSSNTPTPIPSNTPTGTILPSHTPTVTPTTDVENSPTPTPEIGNSPTPTPELENSPTPTVEGEPSLTPTQPIVGFICGRADVNGDGKFGIFDFGGYQVGFASYYQKLCDDTEADHISYGACGGRDYDKRGKVDIVDFQSFAQRYNKDSCAL